MTKKVLFAIGVLPLLLVALWIIGARVVHHFVMQDRSAVDDMLYPEPPLAGDDAYAKVRAIAEEIGEIPEEVSTRCLSNPRQREHDLRTPECRQLLVSASPTLQHLDAWLGSADPFKLAPPDDAGRHSRLPLPLGMSAEIPPFRPFFDLAGVLAIQAVYDYERGDNDSGRARLKTIFDLGDLLLRNPGSLIQGAIGIALQEHGLRVIIDYLGPQQVDQELRELLPDPAQQRQTLVIAIGGEAAMARYTIEHELEQYGPFDTIDDLEQPGEVTEGNTSWGVLTALQLYKKDHMLQVDAERWSAFQRHAISGRLAFEFAPQRTETWEEMGLVRFFHNPVGRILLGIASPSLKGPLARAGSTIDRTAAVRAAVAARLYQRDKGEWPTKPEELTPALLPSWPMSALTGNPLRWDPEQRVVSIPKADGSSPCTEVECVVPLVPPRQVERVVPPASEASPTGKGE